MLRAIVEILFYDLSLIPSKDQYVILISFELWPPSTLFLICLLNSAAEYSNLKLENAVPGITLQLSQEQNLWTLKMVKCHGSTLVSQ